MSRVTEGSSHRRSESQSDRRKSRINFCPTSGCAVRSLLCNEFIQASFSTCTPVIGATSANLHLPNASATSNLEVSLTKPQTSICIVFYKLNLAFFLLSIVLHSYHLIILYFGQIETCFLASSHRSPMCAFLSNITTASLSAYQAPQIC